jgi:glucan phosphoethanolaminetransferase (alkaline phosphatase superfamily)
MKVNFDYFYRQWRLYSAFLVLVLVVNSPIIYGYLVIPGAKLGAALKAFILASSIVGLPIFVGVRSITKVYLYLLGLLVLCLPLHFLYIYLYRAIEFTFDHLAVILETDIPEAVGFLGGYSFYIVGIAFLLLLLYWWSARGVLSHQFSTLQRITAIAIVVALWSYIYLKSDKASIAWLIDRIETAHPTMNFFLLGQQAYQEYQKINDYQTITENFTFHAEKKDGLAEREIYVLIVGETARYSNWEMNGYPRATSPRLKQIENLVSYSDVAAGGPITRIAVPLMITRATAEDFSKTLEEKSVLWAFKESGFSTYWIGNQWQLGNSATITTVYAKDADKVVFLRESAADSVLDEEMLPIFTSVIQNRTEQKLFIVLHMYGSHWAYNKRYPEKFDVFRPSIPQNQLIRMNDNAQKERIVNSYDNAILYTDYFIGAVIEALAQSDAVSYMVFMPDHGEDLLDDERQLFGHGNLSKFSLHIPFFVWTSDRYNRAYPAKQASIRENRHAPIGSDNLFYSLLDLANITYQDEDLTKSIASPTLAFYKRTVLMASDHQIDYDALE